MEDSDGVVSEDDREGNNEPSDGSEEEDGDGDIPSHSEPEEEEQYNALHSPSSKTPAKDPEPTEDLSSTLHKTRDEDRKKGKAVSRQIVRHFMKLVLLIFTLNPSHFLGALGLSSRCSNTPSKICYGCQPTSCSTFSPSYPHWLTLTVPDSHPICHNSQIHQNVVNR